MTYQEMLAQPKPLILYSTSDDPNEGLAYIIKQMDGHLYYWIYGQFSDNAINEWRWFRLSGRNWIEQRWDKTASMEMPSGIMADDFHGMIRGIWDVRLK